MTKIEKLLARLDSATKRGAIRAANIRILLFAEYFKVFADWTALRDDMKRLEESKEYGMGEEYPYRWVRASITKPECALELEALEEYVQENYFVRFDADNDAWTYCLGPCLILDNDGDLFDQDTSKTVIRASAYTNDDGEADEEERNRLIERYMHKTGVFNDVLEVDNRGSYTQVFGHVDTRPKCPGCDKQHGNETPLCAECTAKGITEACDSFVSRVSERLDTLLQREHTEACGESQCDIVACREAGYVLWAAYLFDGSGAASNQFQRLYASLNLGMAGGSRLRKECEGFCKDVSHTTCPHCNSVNWETNKGEETHCHSCAESYTDESEEK